MKFHKYIFVCLIWMMGLSSTALSAEAEYLALFMDGKKVGYAVQTRTVADGKVTTTEKTSITLSRAAIPLTVVAIETSIETIDGKPLAFESVQDMSMMTVKMSGKINPQGQVEVTVNSMGNEQIRTFDWPKGAVMAEGLRLLQLKNGLKKGTTYTAKVYSPSIMQALDAKAEVRDKKNIDLLGRIVSLTEIVSTLTMPGGKQVVATSYVDDELRALKTNIPMMGMQIEMVSCAKEFALSKNEVFEVIDKMFLASPKPLENVGSAKSITYKLKPLGDLNNPPNLTTIPNTDSQNVKAQGNDVLVTVSPITPPTGVKFPYAGKDEKIFEAMKPTRYLQSDQKEIIALAEKAVGGKRKDAAEAAKKIEAFVAEYIEQKNLSIGYATAAEVAQSKQGDCTEFSVLTAAMCRAVGIPARVVMGIAYVKNFQGVENRFGGHAWVQAYIGDKWLDLDASFKSAGLGGFDAGHIALAYGNGNPEDFFNMLNTMGQFEIVEITP